MRFSLPSIKYSVAPPSFRLCCLNRDQRFDLITARSAVVGSWEESRNIWLTEVRNVFVRWSLNFRVRMLLKGAVIMKPGSSYTTHSFLIKIFRWSLSGQRRHRVTRRCTKEGRWYCKASGRVWLSRRCAKRNFKNCLVLFPILGDKRLNYLYSFILDLLFS